MKSGNFRKFCVNGKQPWSFFPREACLSNSLLHQCYSCFAPTDTFFLVVEACYSCLCQISLLCGPPGLGKTTLAHVIAKHAGYNVVEMNARYFITNWPQSKSVSVIVNGRPC